MRDVSIGRGVVRATFAAGPVFAVALAVVQPVACPQAIPVPTARTLAFAPLFLGLSVAVGALLAVGPVLVGAAALGGLGRGNVGVRHPAFWAIVGGLAVAVCIPWRSTNAHEYSAALVLTGAASALLARSGVRWPA